MGNESSAQGYTLHPHREVAAVLPDPREAHAACSFRNELWIVGGARGELLEALNIAWVWSPPSKTWRKIALSGTAPAPRAAQGYSFVAPHFLVLVGGTTPSSGWLSDVCALDLSHQKWITLATTCSEGEGPSPRDKTACCSVGSKLYMIGGFGPRDAATKASDRVEDSVQREEQAAADNEEEPDAVGVEGQAGAATGDEELSGNPDERPQVEGADGKKLDYGWSDELWELDCSHLTILAWRLISKSSGPTPRAAAAMCAVNEKLFIFGGRDAVERRNDLWSYNLSVSPSAGSAPTSAPQIAPASAWQRIDAQSVLPPARSFHSMVAVGSHNLLLFGGLNLASAPLRDFHLFDVETSNWIQPSINYPPSPDANAFPARAFHSCTVLSATKLAVLFGGSAGSQDTSKYFTDLVSLSIDTILHPIPPTGGATPAPAVAAAPVQQRITLPTGGNVPGLLAKPASNVSADSLFASLKPGAALAVSGNIVPTAVLGAAPPILPSLWQPHVKPSAESSSNMRRAESETPEGAPAPASKKTK